MNHMNNSAFLAELATTDAVFTPILTKPFVSLPATFKLFTPTSPVYVSCVLDGLYNSYINLDAF